MAGGNGTGVTGAAAPPGPSLADTQTHPAAVHLIAASLQCDHRAEITQTAYFAAAAAGSVVASALAARLGNVPPVVATVPGLVAGGAVGLVLVRHRSWLAAGHSLREQYERMVFRFPAWTQRPVDAGPSVDHLAAEYLMRDGRRRDSLGQWFDVDRSQPFDRQVLQAQYESVVTGSLTRQLWSLFLAFLLFLVGLFVTVISWVAWPPTVAQVSGWATALLPLGAVAVTAFQSFRYSTERRALAAEVGASLRRPPEDVRLLTLVIEERLVALRSRRVLVPDWFFRLVRPLVRQRARETPPRTVR